MTLFLYAVDVDAVGQREVVVEEAAAGHFEEREQSAARRGVDRT